MYPPCNTGSVGELILVHLSAESLQDSFEIQERFREIGLLQGLKEFEEHIKGVR